MLLGAGVLAVLIAGGLVLLVRSAFPRLSGSVRVGGISGPVRIETDSRGFATIRANAPQDAAFGVGYAHARDRLWQMDFQRRIASGRLSEVLGRRLVATDRFLRTIGFRRAAETSLPALSGRTRGILEAYARGVNAFLASDSSRPIEYRILRCEPEPFSPVDSLAWAKVMAWDLGAGGSTAEIRRARLSLALGRDAAEDLLPEPPPEPTILEAGEWTPTARSAPAARAALPDPRTA